MTLTERSRRINEPKFSFGKNAEYAEQFGKACDAFSMYENGFGLGIPSTMSNENQLWAVFNLIREMNGVIM